MHQTNFNYNLIKKEIIKYEILKKIKLFLQKFNS